MNDCFVKMEGDYTSPWELAGTTGPTTAKLKSNIKFFVGNPYPAFAWGGLLDITTGTQMQIGPKYVFKVGQTYTLVISGRSMRFNPDYFVLFNIAKFTTAQAKAITPNSASTLSVNELQKKKEIKVYFNSSNDHLFYNSAELLINKIQLFDLNGKMVFSTNVQLMNGSFDVSGISKGMYVVKNVFQSQYSNL